MIKLSSNERLLIESGINRYRVIGPGVVALMPWQRKRARFNVGPSVASVFCQKALTLEGVPVNVSAKVIYRIVPEFFSDTLLPRVPKLSEGGWQSVVEWRSKALLRRSLANCDWRDLKNTKIQEELEQRLNDILTKRLKGLGLEILAITILKMELDSDLQKTVTQAEQNVVEAGGRARVLKTYFEIFGDDLERAMPLIKEWELLGLLHKNKNLQSLLMTEGLSNTSLNGKSTNAQTKVHIAHKNGNHKAEEDSGDIETIELDNRLRTNTEIIPFAN